MVETNRVILNFHNSLLRESDVHLLTGPRWLNDQIISFYLEYLEKCVYPNDDRMLFVSPEVVQCLKFVTRSEMNIFLEPLRATQKQFIFLPLNDNNEVKAGGNHWSLLVFSRPEQTFIYYDSISGGAATLRSLRAFLIELGSAIGCPEFDVRHGECTQQTNSYDCGIHVLCTIDCLANRIIKYNAIDAISETMAANRRLTLGDDINDDPKRVTSQQIRQKRKDILNLIQDLGGKL